MSMMADEIGKHAVHAGLLLGLVAGLTGCGAARPAPVVRQTEVECRVVQDASVAQQAELFRRAETDRAEHLTREIARLQTDLERAEAALVEAESGLAAQHSRADAVSSLAVTRIQVERAASRAPWRGEQVRGARSKLSEAERQVSEGRFGAALFFVYRARRVADAILAEAELVMQSPDAQMIRAERVNLRAGPSTNELVLGVLQAGTPVLAQATEGDWMLVQVIGGPAGWIHRQLLDPLVREGSASPAAAIP